MTRLTTSLHRQWAVTIKTQWRHFWNSWFLTFCSFFFFCIVKQKKVRNWWKSKQRECQWNIYYHTVIWGTTQLQYHVSGMQDHHRQTREVHCSFPAHPFQKRMLSAGTTPTIFLLVSALCGNRWLRLIRIIKKMQVFSYFGFLGTNGQSLNWS